MACNTTGDVGRNSCNPNSPYENPTGMIFAKDGVSFSAANFVSYDAWITQIKAGNVFPIMDNANSEENSVDMVFHDRENGTRLKMRDKKYRITMHYSMSECRSREVQKFDNFKGGVFLVYGDRIRGYSDDNGVTIKPLKVENTFIDGTMAVNGTSEDTVVMVDLKSKKQYKDMERSFSTTWETDTLDSLTYVTLTKVTATASEIVVDVTASCGGDSKEISGLGTETTDWVVSTGTISSVTESSTVLGRYTIDGSTMAGTIDLAAPADRSDDVLVKSSGAIDTEI